MASPKIIAADQHYHCTDCGKCCRDWHVEVTAEEATELRALRWDDGDHPPAKPVFRFQGKTFVSHRPDGTCAYFDTAAGNCRIHAKHGADAKPLGCRLYPLQFSRLASGQHALSARADCPAVVAETGPLLSASRKDAEKLLRSMPELPVPSKEDASTLTPDTVHVVLAALSAGILDADVPLRQKAIALNLAASRLECLGAIFLNDKPIRDEVLETFFTRVLTDVPELRLRKQNIVEKWRYMSLLTTYLRRDEALIGGGLPARIRNANALRKLTLGKGNLRELDKDYPDGIIGHLQLLGEPAAAPPAESAARIVRLLKVRLQTQQFYGSANFGLEFFEGLRSVALTVPLIVGAARWRALCELRKTEINDADIQFGISAIDHSFGRMAVLRTPLFRILARQAWQPEAYARHISAIIQDQTYDQF